MKSLCTLRREKPTARCGHLSVTWLAVTCTPAAADTVCYYFELNAWCYYTFALYWHVIHYITTLYTQAYCYLFTNSLGNLLLSDCQNRKLLCHSGTFVPFGQFCPNLTFGSDLGSRSDVYNLIDRQFVVVTVCSRILTVVFTTLPSEILPNGFPWPHSDIVLFYFPIRLYLL